MKRCLVAVVLALLLVVCQAYAEPVVRTFDNGMTVVVDEVHAAPVAAVRFYVRAGSMYEDNYLGCGITHFLEHLVGRGSTHRTAEEINAIQEALGNQANAYTSVDHTCYWMTGPARKVEDMVDLISDYVFNPLLTPQDVETQRGVILREMAMGEDDPGRRLSNLMTQTLLRLHPARYRIIGYPDRFKSVTREDIVSYHQRMYTTDNVVAVVVGDFETDRVMKALEQSVGRIPRRAVNLPTLAAGTRADQFAACGGSRPESLAGVPGPGLAHGHAVLTRHVPPGRGRLHPQHRPELQARLAAAGGEGACRLHHQWLLHAGL